MALIKEPYGLVRNTDGTLCTTYRDDVGPFRGVRSFAVEEATTNLSPQTMEGWKGISLVYKGEENGWKKYGISGTWNSGTYPYCARIGEVSFTGGEYYSTSAFFKTNCQEKFASYFEAINYVNESRISDGTNIRRVLNDGSIYLARNGFAYVNSTSQLGYITLRPKQDGETFNPDQHFLYVKNIQTEHLPFATSYVDGSRPNGKLELENTANVDTTNLVLCWWFKFFDSRSRSTWGRIIEKATGSQGANGFVFATSPDIIFSVDNTKATFFTPQMNKWYYCILIFDNGVNVARVYDEDIIHEATITKTVPTNANNITLGSSLNYNAPMNGLVSNFFIGKYRKPNGTVIWTDDYIREVYEAKIPFPVQSQLSIY